ncbi:MAG: methionyl-tRNA formyltransferase [Prevotella sp.]|nr:methionyl-tRNA formyltransferase [Prevotella sp.]
MKKEDLRIVFMGTPEFAVETLKALVDNHYNVVGVVTQPDKPVGRHGSVLQAPAVKQFAVEHGIPVLQPEKMKDPLFVEKLRFWDATLQVVVAFRMLPEIVWAMPQFGTFNVHAALLPDYRGAAPINWAIINGETKTGVTTFFLDHDIDTGRIIRQKPFDIPETADVEYVYDGLMQLGAELCIETIEDIIATDGHPEALPQDNAKAIHTAPKLFKENCRIDWTALTAKQAHDLIRGLSPIPGAWTMLKAPDGTETMLKIYKSLPPTPSKGKEVASPGQLSRDKKHLYVACKDALLQIESLQLAGKKRMDAISFMNGFGDIEKYSVV